MSSLDKGKSIDIEKLVFTDKNKKKGKTTESRSTFKPFSFPWAMDSCELQNKMHWIPQEINLNQDLIDFNETLLPHEKNLIIQILRFFTQSDLEVGRSYLDYYIPIFKCPEVRMMLTTFASMEVIHVLAYSYLITSLKLPDEEYSAFLQYEEMVNKYNYMQNFDVSNPQSVALTLAIVSGFIEGFVLFSSFAILMYFSMQRGETESNCLKGLGQIVSFSIRDETLHSISVMKLFHEYVEENKDVIDIQKLEKDIYSNCKQLFEYESKFIDLAFAEGDLSGLKKEDLKNFIKYLCDLRLKQLGLDPIFNCLENPLAWTNNFLFPRELSNFFEVIPTSYAKSNYKNSDIENLWDEFKE